MKKYAVRIFTAAVFLLFVCGLFACAPKTEDYKLTKMYASVNGEKTEIEKDSAVYKANKELYGETLKVSEKSVIFGGTATKALPGDFTEKEGKVKFNSASVDPVYSGKKEEGKFTIIKGTEKAGFILEYGKLNVD